MSVSFLTRSSYRRRVFSWPIFDFPLTVTGMCFPNNERESQKNILPYGTRITRRKGRPILKPSFGRCSNLETIQPYRGINLSISNSCVKPSKPGWMSNQVQRHEWNAKGKTICFCLSSRLNLARHFLAL